jgi:hypothetical protein
MQLDCAIQFIRLADCTAGEAPPKAPVAARIIPCGSEHENWEEEQWRGARLAHVGGMAFSPSGTALALVGGLGWSRDEPYDICVYKFPSLALQVHLEFEWRSSAAADPFTFLRGLPVEHVAFDADGERLFVPTGDGLIAAIDTASGEMLQEQRIHDDLVTSTDVQGGGGLLLTGSWNGEIAITAIN